MASIDFCPLAKWVGEWRSEGRSWGRGIARPALERSARKGGDTAMIAKRGRLRPRQSSPCARGQEQAPEPSRRRGGCAASL